LTRLQGGAVYHLCYTTASLVDSLGQLGMAALDLPRSWLRRPRFCLAANGFPSTWSTAWA
jgi:hypothetical protein